MVTFLVHRITGAKVRANPAVHTGPSISIESNILVGADGRDSVDITLWFETDAALEQFAEGIAQAVKSRGVPVEKIALPGWDG